MPSPDTTHDAFQLAYRSIEQQMKARAEEDGNVFLPSAAPAGPVDYVLICMEPSLGRWATSAAQARERVEGGFRNFLSSIEGFILHFSAQAFLCASGERYHITDFSKGAMLVKNARAARAERYDKWYPLLMKEIELVASSRAGFVAVGSHVAGELERRGFRRPLVKVIHYSGQAARARKAFVAEHKADFEKFRETVSLRDIRAAAEEVLRSANVPPAFREEALGRLDRTQLTESRKQLVFNYKVKFESLRLQLGCLSLPHSAS